MPLLTAPLPEPEPIDYTTWRDFLHPCIRKPSVCPHCATVTDPRTALHCRRCCETFETTGAANVHAMGVHCIAPETITSLERHGDRWRTVPVPFAGLGVGSYGGRASLYFNRRIKAEKGRMTEIDRRDLARVQTAEYEAARVSEPRGLLPTWLVRQARAWVEIGWVGDTDGIPEPVAAPGINEWLPDTEPGEALPAVARDVDLSTGHAEEVAVAEGRRGARDLGAPPPDADADEANHGDGDEEEAGLVLDHLLGVA